MLDLLRKELNKQNVFNQEFPDIINMLTKSITAKIPTKMKITLAINELVLFVSHFRRNILHWNGSNIPINSITFCLAKSGASKDSSVKMLRKCFEDGYTELNKLRKTKAEEAAINKAMEDGAKDPSGWSTYKEYFNPPNPLFVAPSTVEGFIQHLNDLDEVGIGAGFIYSGEFGSELSTNPNLTENIRLLAELYDEGTKELKVLKDRTSQAKEIINLPVSALFIGSQDNVLLDENIKRKFKTEFTTKLARRSFFNYNSENIDNPSYSSIDDLLKAERNIELYAIKNRFDTKKYIADITEDLLNNMNKPIEVSSEVIDLFLLYKRYNEELAETMEYQLQISKLSRLHLQWKALKLSGAFALIHGNEEITEQDYKYAITFTELLHNDIIDFEKELSKEPYEMFVDYVHNYTPTDNQVFIDAYTLKKLGYINNNNNLLNKIKDLTILASSYDTEGVYAPKEDGILFQKLEATNVVGVSYLYVNGNKEQRKKKCAKGYDYYETDFETLGYMLEEDLAYCPFKFKDGIRGKENIIGGCKWVSLDIDNASITDEEAHLLLEDLNHHIARTSDPDNPFKFRLLIELDTAINISDEEWKHFIYSVSREIGIDTDLLPKSQIFYSYSGRKVMSVTDGYTLKVKDHLLYASNKILNNEPSKPVSKTAKRTYLDDRRNTFAPAYDAKNGEGSRKMIWAAKYARELGADKDEIIDIVTEINNFWVVPLEEDRFKQTILNQIKRWS